ncbi:MAG: DUF3471 domain-containing protein, partial [Gemmatimonadetes bacterium]|nr:DUF3471 domain-containing protein [Gemmatimonadota bacterium]NIR75646.1 DUF3471 domain-containing protein [Candidatus Kutchimonas denitrificans]NIR99625.1 DUF3471 domain-containing protein [Gemmatimonadota bacterium]NIT65900.1 DUF3471 domain-containing protein [Gemmatimonadota bacterium]NIV22069.1 DUF3471 domain-containing protein [Gemmatimonadota bacterium]
GRRAISHGGGIPGYLTQAIYIPGQEIFVAVFSNNTASDIGPGMVARKLAAIALGDPYPEWEEIALDPSVLQRYVGVYRIDESTQRVVTVENGTLYTQRSGGSRLRAYPSSETHFFYGHSLSHFEFVLEGDRVVRMLMYQGGARTPEVAVKVSDEVPTREAVELDPAILERYVGVYELRPGFDLTITREDDQLFVQATGQPRFELFAESETEFFLKVVDAQITFVRGDSGAFDELVLHQGGRDMPGTRKQ